MSMLVMIAALNASRAAARSVGHQVDRGDRRAQR
jgi:hypothetical protein